MLQIHNTESRTRQEFKPIDPGLVRMYVCGITSYDDCHLGHGRAYVVFDLVRRYLIYKGYAVKYVQNFTDIDDKILDRAAEIKEDWGLLSRRYQDRYFEVMDRLNVLRADVYPRATETIPEMLETIKKLITGGFAYELEGDVYFEVRKFKNYGKLSGKNIDDLEAGARVEVNSRKKDPLDFALWKKSKPGEPSWESPWGQGRPGWHIECSAMSQKFLRVPFDIHGGGADLIFPHHENETAQSEAAFGGQFARFWIHNGFVTINQEKMSKSLKNFFTPKDIFEKYSPMVVRLFLISLHYRSPLNFSDENLTEARTALTRLQATADLVRQDFFKEYSGKFRELLADKYIFDRLESETMAFKTQFEAAQDDDFNSAQALAVIFNLSAHLEGLFKKKNFGRPFIEGLALFYKLNSEVLGLTFTDSALPPENAIIIKKRESARLEKDWSLSDELRKQSMAAGFEIQDTVLGSRWTRIL